MDTSEKSKRIAKNTGAIYVRMMILMLTTLYTSRIVLQQLGVIDFGINNVVAGIVALLAFYTSSLSNASQRYLSIGLGENDTQKTKLYFKQCLSLMVIFSAIILLLAESVGLWLVCTKLSIPCARLGAATWTYHFAILSMICSILQVPFMAEIIANERMKMYAHIGLFEGVARLAIAYLLAIGTDDKLILYGVLSALVSILTLGLYIIYSRMTFAECRISWIWNWQLVKEMLRFISYTMFGCLAWSASNQGINIILNIFFGPAINTARGIALQVCAAIDRFASSLMTASAPQIIKSYAERDIAYMTAIIEKTSKFAFFLSCAIAVPLICETTFILRIWLGTVPDYTVLFTRLLIIDSLINIAFQPLTTAANATGRIKGIQVYGRCITLLALPISYALLSLYHNPMLAIYTVIATDVLYGAYCLANIHQQIGLSITLYLRHSVWPSAVLFGISMGACWIVYAHSGTGGFISFALTTMVGIISCAMVGYLLLTTTERAYIRTLIKKK